jgi:hypothetical protein
MTQHELDHLDRRRDLGANARAEPGAGRHDLIGILLSLYVSSAAMRTTSRTRMSKSSRRLRWLVIAARIA